MSRAAANTKKPIASAPTAGRAQPTPTVPTQTGSIREVKPTVDQVRTRAYQIYIERTARGDRGDAAADWIRAERELSHKSH